MPLDSPRQFGQPRSDQHIFTRINKDRVKLEGTDVIFCYQGFSDALHLDLRIGGSVALDVKVNRFINPEVNNRCTACGSSK